MTVSFFYKNFCENEKQPRSTGSCTFNLIFGCQRKYMKYGLTLLIIVSQVVHAQHKFIHFVPDTFSNVFSLNRTPVLTINVGDTVSTETIDAMGYDKNGMHRQKGEIH